MIAHRTSEWFKARIGKFTASNFPDLMSKPADKSALISKSALNCIETAAAQLFYNQYHERADSEPTRWGLRYESMAIQVFSERTNFQTKELGFVIHPLISSVGATPDTQVIDFECLDKLILAQIKCPYSSEYHKDYLNKIYDTTSLKKKKSAFFWQMQGEMWITNADYSYFVSFDPRLLGRNECLHFVKILRDESAINEIEIVIKKSIELRDIILDDFKKGIRYPKSLSDYY
ncbi:MAG: YqaJ viral recombinase family protein [Chitinophagales bacterium]|nr:YqaJ viral recombinase family protein [Chitinophagales bacterium]